MLSNLQGILKRYSNRQSDSETRKKSQNGIVYGQSGKPGTSDLEDALKRQQLRSRRVTFQQ